MSVSRYKVGDIAKVREDLDPFKIYGGVGVNDTMVSMRGCYLKIWEVYHACGDNGYDGYYTVHGNIWCWTDEMFEDYIAAAKNVSEHERCDDSIMYSETSESDLLKLYKPRGKS